MQVTCFVRAIRLNLRLEQARFQGREKTTSGADHPPGKRGNRDADLVSVIKPVCLRGYGDIAQLSEIALYLRPSAMLLN